MSHVADRIRARRLELKMTQEALADRAGISKGFLSDLENGKRNVSVEKLNDVARVLGVSIDYLMGTEDVKPSTGEVQIPAALADLARVENLPFVKILMLLDMQRQIVAHRSSSRKEDDIERVDWRRFYERVKEFL